MILQRKGSPYWYAVFRIGGKLKWHSTRQTGKTLALAVHDTLHKKIREDRSRNMVACILGEKPKTLKPLTLEQAWAKYCLANKQWSDSGRKVFACFSKWYGKDRDIAEVNADTALNFLALYKNNSGKTHNTYKSALSKIWKTLVPFSEISGNPWQAITNRPAESEYFRPFTEKEYKNILKKTKDTFWYYACIISWNTGLRRKDILTLRWDQIGEDKAIEKTPTKTAKNKKKVYIPLRKEVLNILKELKSDSPYVFPVESQKLNSGTFDAQFGAILDGLGIVSNPPALVSFRSLRTSFITRMGEAGISDKVIMGIVGHGSPLMTERYNHDKKSAKAILSV